ncbi:MAG: hypothetical protein AAF587_23930 [Bacteroidota bacterium]
MRLKSIDIMHQAELVFNRCPRSFFTYTFTLLITSVLCCSASSSIGQNLDECERDYSLLQRKVRTHWDDLHHGANFFLSQEYIQTIRQGVYDYSNSQLIFFDYLRPATRQELRQGKVEEFQREAVGVDGNIYVAKRASGKVHFFQPNVAFEGYFHAVEGDSLLLLPVGLDPIDVEVLEDMPLILQERTAQYLLFDLRGEPIVFYIGTPSISFVFENQASRDAIADKELLAKALVGKTFLIRRQSELRFRSSPNGNDQTLEIEEEELSITVTNTWVDRDKVLLITTERRPRYFVLDEESDFLMFDEECVEAKREHHRKWMLADTEDAETNNRLNEMLMDSVSNDDWRLDPWAVGVISQRFMLSRSPGNGPLPYTYVLDEENRQKESFLSATVNEQGQFWLTSQYSSDEGLYHTRIIVYVGEDSLFSSRISALDKRNQRMYEQGRVIERLRLNGEKDHLIIQTIARTQEKDIRIRFTSGGSFYDDIYLSKMDHQTIRDVWMMSQMIRQKEAMSLRE